MTAANPMRGEVALGDRKLIVTFNTVCALEEVTGRKVLDLVDEMAFGLGLSDLRQWVQVFVNEPMTLEQVGDWLGEIGIEPTSAAIVKAFEQFFPAQKKGKAANPPKAE